MAESKHSRAAKLKSAAAELGRAGGKARAESMTADERSAYWSEIAKLPRKKNAPRCPCGQYTLHTAKLRGHRCTAK